MSDYERLRELAEKATPGPWHLDSLESGEHGLFIDQERAEEAQLGCGGTEVAGFMTRANAEYLAELTPDVVLNLLAELHFYKTQMREARAIAWDIGAQAGLDWDKSYPANIRDSNPFKEGA